MANTSPVAARRPASISTLKSVPFWVTATVVAKCWLPAGNGELRIAELNFGQLEGVPIEIGAEQIANDDLLSRGGGVLVVFEVDAVGEDLISAVTKPACAEAGADFLVGIDRADVASQKVAHGVRQQLADEIADRVVVTGDEVARRFGVLANVVAEIAGVGVNEFEFFISQ